jgi:hypothetical protein
VRSFAGQGSDTVWVKSAGGQSCELACKARPRIVSDVQDSTGVSSNMRVPRSSLKMFVSTNHHRFCLALLGSYFLRS